MAKECQSCVKEGIGCKDVQRLFKDVDKLKMNKKLNGFLYVLILVVCVAFVITSFVIWKNMLQQPLSTANIPQNELKNITDLFNSQFSSLLTVLGILLSVFGVVLPIVNAIYQKQTLKDERESLRREIAVSLANIEARGKAIEDATDDFQNRQDNFDEKLIRYEKDRCFDNGYFMQQLASYAPERETKLIYYCNALPYFSKDAESKRAQQRIDSILNNLKTLITFVSLQTFIEETFNNIMWQLDITRNNLAGNYVLCKKIDEIKDLFEKKRAESDDPVAHPIMATPEGGK